jgi:hypothetical protein
MKQLRQLCAAGALTLALALSAFAGDIDTPGITAPPPPPSQSVTGEIQTPGVTSSSDIAADSVLEIALDLMQGVLSLF